MLALSQHSAAQTSYTEELADEIIARLSSGETLHAICRSDDRFPAPSAISDNWCDSIPRWRERYARARNLGLDYIAEDALRIADDLTEDPNSRRIRVDTRKWLLSKLRPDKYGDRVAIEHSVGESIADILRKRRAAIVSDAQVTIDHGTPLAIDKP